MSDIHVSAGITDVPVRSVQRRHGLPGTRAVVGALLIVAAAVGTFAAYLSSTAAPTTGYLTAAAPIAIGEIIEASDITVALADIDPLQSASILREFQRDELVGTIAAVPIPQGAYLLGAMVQSPDDLAGELFSFSLPVQRALGGNVAPPTVIDLVATYGSGPDAETLYIARGIPVTRVGGSDSGLSGGSVLITVLLPDPAMVLRVTHALGNAEVWLTRSGASEGQPPTYQFDGQ